MIIDVKATKAKDEEKSSNPYEFTEEKPSRSPVVFSLLLTGMALYLKSVFPGWAQAAAYPGQEPEPEESKSAPKLVLIPGDNVPDFPVDPQPVGDIKGISPGRFIGSGGKLIDLQSPASFMVIESPDADVLPTYEAELLRSLISPTGQRSANDKNGPGANSGSPEAGEGLLDDGFVPGLDAVPGDQDDEDDVEPDQDDDDDEDDDDDGTGNRAPRSTGPVYLNDVVGCMAAVIALGELLRNASDPDGDALSIANLTVSSGTLTQTTEGWTFSGGLLGPITLTYEITDGVLSIVQNAYFSVLRNRPILGTAGSDLLVGTECADDIDGGACDDNIDGRGGNDTIEGGDGSDHIVAGSGDDLIRAGDGNDFVLGGDGIDWISGGKGDDRLFGGNGDDTIFGDAGDDVLRGDDGADLLFGGTGNDLAFGGAGRDVLDGGDGEDNLSGGGGNDAMFGGAGSDLLKGGDGNDLLSGQLGEDLVLAEAGDDTIVGDADSADDSYDGGDGTDTLDYSAAECAVYVDLARGTATGSEIGTDTVTRIETIQTGFGSDRITGSDQSERLSAGGGDDLIADGGGCDVIDAGDGDDTVVASLDAKGDQFEGGSGADTLDYSGTMSGILIDLSEHTATGIEIGADMISGFEAIIGGAGDDHFVITEAPVSLQSGAGSDLFEFEAVTSMNAGAQVVHDILDFMVGDRIKVSKYEIFKEVMDSLEDRFEDIYGNDVAKEDLPIRIRHEQTDNILQTLIDVDFDEDQIYDMTINISGDHVLMVVDNA